MIADFFFVAVWKYAYVDTTDAANATQMMIVSYFNSYLNKSLRWDTPNKTKGGL
ncbi:MAG: hypothetical protein HY088_02530 [Ignavibacteriales bacterium]|nr:hypothetical protein [Ignavibacteriales bacterium]